MIRVLMTLCLLTAPLFAKTHIQFIENGFEHAIVSDTTEWTIEKDPFSVALIFGQAKQLPLSFEFHATTYKQNRPSNFGESFFMWYAYTNHCLITNWRLRADVPNQFFKYEADYITSDSFGSLQLYVKYIPQQGYINAYQMIIKIEGEMFEEQVRDSLYDKVIALIQPVVQK